MSNLFGFDLQQAQKERDESMPKNLTAGKYKLMVTAVDEGVHPFGGQFTQPCTNPLDPDKEIRVSCVLVDAANGFKEGWKHTLFFSPYRPDKDNPGKLSVKALIDRGLIADLAFACCGTEPKSPQEMVQKMFYITLKETTGKDGKTYMNVDKIEPLFSNPAVDGPSATSVAGAGQPIPLQSANVETNTAEPNWLA